MEAALVNRSGREATFQIRELFLRSSTRGMWPATGGEVTDLVRLKTGQRFNVFATFDIVESEIDEDASLQLHWVRHQDEVRMLRVPHPPDHFHEGRGGEDRRERDRAWPERVTGLPPGDPFKGKVLYLKTLGCVSCHGHPDIDGSNAVGPDLGNVGGLAAERVPGKNAVQYLYESILTPDAHVVESKGQVRGAPSAMTPFGQLLTPKGAADLVAYLLSLRDVAD